MPVENNTIKTTKEFSSYTNDNGALIHNRLFFSLLLTGIYLLIGIVGILHHEMWRDEYHDWLLAQNSHSIIDLWNNTKYDSHAFLWKILPFILTQFTQDPLAMQFLHILLAAISVWIITFFSPFTRFQQALLVFGYFFLYEYAIISRYYVLTALLLLITLSLFNASSKRPIIFSIVLFLLANTSPFGIVFSSLFMALAIHHFITGQQREKRFPAWNCHRFIAVGIFISGVLFSSYSVLRGILTSLKPSQSLWQIGLNMERLEFTLSRILAVFIPIPNTLSAWFWNTSIAFNWPPVIRIIVSICLMTFFFVVFWDKKHIVAFWGIGILAIGVFRYFLIYPSIRYEGHIFLLLVASLWLMKKGNGRSEILELKSHQKFQSHELLFNTILILHVVAGFIAYSLDIRFPFSNCNAAGRYLAKNTSSAQCLFGSYDFIMEPLIALVNKPIYYPERDSIGTFLIWDDRREDRPPTRLIIEKAIRFVRFHCDSTIMILSGPLIHFQGYDIVEVKDQQLTKDVHITFLKAFDTPCIARDEVYYIYQLSRVRNNKQ